MSDLNEISRAKGRNVIEYASKQMNELDSKNTMEGIKTIANTDRKVYEAILAYRAEKDKIIDNSDFNRNPTVTGEEIKKAREEGEYREMLDR